MKISIRATLIFIATSLLFFLLSPPILAEAEKIELVFKNQTLSAKVREASLSSVIEKIKGKKGVWFKVWAKGKKFLFEKFSVQFKGLSVQDGMRRILSGINHSMIFDKNGELLGVILLGKPDRKWSRYRRRPVVPRRSSRRYRRR
ncbi:MAG: hypothetical protein ISS66_03610 [Desulfobacteraceae bacterium]|nr:hypothetical protein [Desulfobacteraceae bacterium]